MAEAMHLKGGLNAGDHGVQRLRSRASLGSPERSTSSIK